MMRHVNKRKLAIAAVVLIGLAGIAVGAYGIWYLSMSPGTIEFQIYFRHG
jgi:hypothetical protein